MSYLVETYGSGGTAEPAAAAAAIGQVVVDLRREGSAIDFLGAMEIPRDETTFYLFEATSMHIVEEAIRRAGLVAERVVEAVASELSSRWPAVTGDGGPDR